LERSGAGENGTITALYTVLVEGDDLNEPITDAVRGILDGHLVLSRSLANMNHYPAIDVLDSVSRLTRDLCSPEELDTIAHAREHLAIYRKNEDLVSIGAYQKGSNAALDQAVDLYLPLRDFLRQNVQEHVPRNDSFAALKAILT
jgi:flagellum-specific ATP synthase